MYTCIIYDNPSRTMTRIICHHLLPQWRPQKNRQPREPKLSHLRGQGLRCGPYLDFFCCKTGSSSCLTQRQNRKKLCIHVLSVVHVFMYGWLQIYGYLGKHPIWLMYHLLGCLSFDLWMSASAVTNSCGHLPQEPWRGHRLGAPTSS